jgi:penicillin-binding protein 2
VMDPRDGGVLALYSAPSWDPNRFIGGIPTSLWRELNDDPRRPLYNKVLQGRYEPGSAFKLATAVVALQENVATMRDRMPAPCIGGFTFGGRFFRCWEAAGHGHVDMARAIELSCNVYFYQLGLRLGVSRLVAGGVALGMNERSGIDLPDEVTPRFPYAVEYYDRRYGPRGWTSAVALNLSIGQGENAQTVVNMARFYSALATGGIAATPEIVKREPERTRVFEITNEQSEALRAALAGVVSYRGTAGSAAIQGVVLAGKTSTAQNPRDPVNHHAWFVGFAPAEQPTVVVAVMLEFGQRGGRAARIASRIVEYHLKTQTTHVLVEGE